MKDLLGQELKNRDLVVYVYTNENGKLSTKKGEIVGFNSKGAKVVVGQDIINVKNIIKTGHKNNLIDLFKMRVLK